jgi:hypothetical protein
MVELGSGAASAHARAGGGAARELDVVVTCAEERGGEGRRRASPTDTTVSGAVVGSGPRDGTT